MVLAQHDAILQAFPTYVPDGVLGRLKTLGESCETSFQQKEDRALDFCSIP